MSEYDKFSKFYDEIIGQYFDITNLIISWIEEYNPKAKSLLELGCGTGGNLKELSDRFDVSGIDISDEMLMIAKKKLPNVKFSKQDISNFQLDKKFDVIICIYDTINHLLSFDKWQSLFKSVSGHLNENGLFIFDINTLFKLQNISISPHFVHEFNNNFLLIKVTETNGNIYDWDLKVFEKLKEDKFKLHKAVITETSFELNKIKKELKNHFKIKNVLDFEKDEITKSVERKFFVCQK